jgi:hypothetical protein
LSGGNERIGDIFQSAQEEAVVFVNERKAAVLEEAQIEQKEAAAKLRAGFKESALVGGFVGDFVGDHRLIGDVVNKIQNDAGGVIVCCLKLREELL